MLSACLVSEGVCMCVDMCVWVFWFVCVQMFFFVLVCVYALWVCLCMHVSVKYVWAYVWEWFCCACDNVYSEFYIFDGMWRSEKLSDKNLGLSLTKTWCLVEPMREKLKRRRKIGEEGKVKREGKREWEPKIKRAKIRVKLTRRATVCWFCALSTRLS